MDVNRQYPQSDSALKKQNVAKLPQALRLRAEGVFIICTSGL